MHGRATRIRRNEKPPSDEPLWTPEDGMTWTEIGLGLLIFGAAAFIVIWLVTQVLPVLVAVL